MAKSNKNKATKDFPKKSNKVLKAQLKKGQANKAERRVQKKSKKAGSNKEDDYFNITFDNPNGEGRRNKRAKSSPKRGSLDSTASNKSRIFRYDLSPSVSEKSSIRNTFDAILKGNKNSNNGNQAAPWMTNTTTDDASATTASTAATTPKQSPSKKRRVSTNSSSVRFPTSELPEEVMAALDEEMDAFGKYVQLSDQECNARHNFVDQISKIAREMFSSHQRFDTSGRPVKVDGNIGCQIFGSFATKQVCTYHSDVDLALWGVVPPPYVPVEIKTIKQKRKETEQEEIVLSDSSSSESSIKRERERKWKEALAKIDQHDEVANGIGDTEEEREKRERKRKEAMAMIDQHNEISNGHVDTEEENTHEVSSEDDASSPDDINKSSSNVENDPFVIDRVGEDIKDEISDTVTSEKLGDANEDGIKSAGKEKISAEAAGTTVETQVNAKIAKALVEESKNASASIICIDHSSDENKSDFERDEESDADSADKMASFLAKAEEKSFCKGTPHFSFKTTVETTKTDKKSPDSRRISSLKLHASGSESDCEDSSSNNADEASEVDDSEIEVSFFSRKRPATPKSINSTVGPTGNDRKQVVNSLGRFSRKLKKSHLTKSVQLIKNARVPIIKISTALGFETDIAIGGHNGTDTSLYASGQVDTFRSFSPVVLLLKVLLAHNGLDVPFTGGLGSYKLYVLVASHLKQHLVLGGSDRPGEVLLNFLYRYGGYKGQECDPQLKTVLNQHCTVESDGGGLADLSSVKRLADVVELFRVCWNSLFDRLLGARKQLKRKNNKGQKQSLLCSIIKGKRLENERQSCLDSLQQSVWRLSQSKAPQASETSSAGSNFPRKRPAQASQTAGKSKKAKRELSADRLLAGYGVSIEELNKFELSRIR